MTPQSTFMICAQIDTLKKSELKMLLASINNAPGMANPKNELIPFYQFSRLHDARLVIIETDAVINNNDELRKQGLEPTDWKPTLAFIGDIDGDTNLFLAELVVRAEKGLRRVFSHCVGFDERETDLLKWMKQNNKKPTANYVNWRGRTVLQIKEEQLLATVLRKKLNSLNDNSKSQTLQGIRSQLKNAINDDLISCRLRLSLPEPTPPAWFIKHYVNMLLLPFMFILLTPILVVLAPFYFLYLRHLEKTDFESSIRAPNEHLLQLSTQEDIDVTNHFNVFGYIKPGVFRRYTILSLLFLLNFACQYIYYCGYLTRIKTIHFARWVMLDNQKQVYFASNYDGSADSYMDDFINKVAWGLNLVFSNGVGYPRTRWLIKGGAEYEEKYKRKLRCSQFPSESWYRAYPGLTAIDLARHTQIRKGLEAKKLNSQEIQAWLRLL